MPFAALLTGMSGSGKTTIARVVAGALRDKGIAVEIIDGDETRELIDGLFGHSREERFKMGRVNRAIGHFLLKNGISVIYALVCPYEELRRQFRDFFGDSYVEVYVSASEETCAARDVKGLYRLAREGKLDNLNGANDEFEMPERSDLVIDTDKASVEEATAAFISLLQKKGHIYKYITDDNLENRQDYMYSDYAGAEFLRSYQKSRSDFLVSAMPLSADNHPRGEGGPVADALSAILEALREGRAVEDAARRIDAYTKSFEVRKKLFSEYRSDRRPTAGARYDDPYIYMLLAECELEMYERTGCLKYLNTLLKIDDTLLSIAYKMTDAQKARTASILRGEMTAFRALAHTHGVIVEG